MQAAQVLADTKEQSSEGKRFGQGEAHATYADPNDGSDLEQLEPHGVALGFGHLRVAQAVLPKSTHHDVGHCRQAEPHLVGAHGRTTHAVGERTGTTSSP